MDSSWLITDEALEHDPDCNYQGMPMDVCNCQQEQLIRMINEREAALRMAQTFAEDVMPQIGTIVLQDYANLNNMFLAFTSILGKK